MTAQGSAHSRFKRALATGKPSIATAAALELPQVLLEDALGLVLLYRDAGDERFERAALRWHLLLLSELPTLGLAGASVSAQALLAIGGGQLGRGAEALAQLLEEAGAPKALAALDAWVDGLSRG